MSALVVVAAATPSTCDRCAADVTPQEERCPRCGRPAPSSESDVPAESDSNPVVLATSGRRAIAFAVSMIVPLVLAAAALVIVLTFSSTVAAWLTAGATLLAVLVVDLVGFARRGTAIGALVTRTRVVKASSGTPLTARQIGWALGGRRESTAAWLAGADATLPGPVNRLTGTVTVDLQRGSDPALLRHGPLTLPVPARATSTATRVHSPDPVPPGPQTEALRLEFDSGHSVSVASITYLGRDPSVPTGAPVGTLTTVPDPALTLSKTHALLAWDGTELVVEDLDSTNGTMLVSFSRGFVPLPPRARTVVPLDASLRFGDRTARVARPGLRLRPGGRSS